MAVVGWAWAVTERGEARSDVPLPLARVDVAVGVLLPLTLSLVLGDRAPPSLRRAVGVS